jgi:hypothetical protein
MTSGPAGLPPNDWLTLIISTTALVVSIIATFIGLRLQRREMRIAVRDQMTSVVQDLITTQTELNLLPPDTASSSEASRALNHKLTSLARQAMELDKIEGSVAFDVELIAIANALWTNGDRVAAERFFQRAAEEAPSDFYRSVNLRMYGGFLYQNGQPDQARTVFERAASCIACAHDLDKLHCAEVQQEWLGHEIAQPVRTAKARECYFAARQFLESISDVAMREQAMNEFHARWQWAGLADGPAPFGSRPSPT